MAIRASTKTGLGLSVSIERMSEHDLLEVVEIEKLSGISPWGWDAYHNELQSTDSIMLVARDSENRPTSRTPVMGFIVARFIADEMHVNNVAVRAECRRSGIGMKLVSAILDRA